MCIRALDYIPPVDVTFGEYLRALITADYDLVRDDDRSYRVSIVSAFRDWGIYPADVRSLSVDSLIWCPVEVTVFQNALDFFHGDRPEEPGPAAPPKNGRECNCVRFEDWKLRSDRLKAFIQMHEYGERFHDWLRKNVTDGRDRFLGLALGKETAPASIRRDQDGNPVFEVHSLRPCRRIGPDGQEQSDIVVEIVQRRKAFFDQARQKELEDRKVTWKDAKQDFYFRGGCTLIIDPLTGDIRYCIRKSILQEERLNAERLFRQGQFGDRVGGLYLADDSERGNPFAFLHGG